MPISEREIEKLAGIAGELRSLVIEMLLTAKSGHAAGSLGMADVFTALYFAVAKIDPAKPRDPKRDRIILSNGHICPILYAALAKRGFFAQKELATLRQLGSRLQGHPHFGELPGVETTSGSLGQGLSQAVGMALGLRLDKNPARVFCLLSDGEHNEGQIWEAAMCAAKYRLNNLTAVLDRNNIQISGHTEEVMPLEPVRAKYEAFGWHVLEVDGHNIRAIIDALHTAKTIFGRPTLILTYTTPGKGVDFMENQVAWHGKTPSADEARLALHEIRTLRGRIRGEHQ